MTNANWLELNTTYWDFIARGIEVLWYSRVWVNVFPRIVFLTCYCVFFVLVFVCCCCFVVVVVAAAAAAVVVVVVVVVFFFLFQTAASRRWLYSLGE